MLPKQHRLPGYRIPLILKEGIRIKTHVATLISHPGESPSTPSRITVIVPYRLSKKAVLRNRTKRLIRAAIYHHLGELTAGIDAIVMAEELTGEKKLVDVKPSVTSLLKKGKLLPIKH